MYDVETYFPEEEWNLLHEWQKELYKNVMNEIHQALISLGPLIATTVFSLRANESEPLYPALKQDSKRRSAGKDFPGGATEHPAVSLGIKGKGHQYAKCTQDTERTERNEFPSTGHCIPISDTSVGIDKHKEAYIWDHQGPVKRMDITTSTSVKSGSCLYPESTYPNTAVRSDISLRIQAEDLPCRNWSGSEVEEINNCPAKGLHGLSPVLQGPPFEDMHSVEMQIATSQSRFLLEEAGRAQRFFMGHPIEEGKQSTIPSPRHEFISFTIKEEEEMCTLDCQEVKTGDLIINNGNLINNSSSTQTGNGNQPRKESECFDHNPPCKDSLRRTSMPKTTEKEINLGCHLWTEDYWESGVKATDCDIEFGNPVNGNLYLGTQKAGPSEMYNECQSNVKNGTSTKNTTQSQRPYIESEQILTQKSEPMRHLRKKSGVGPYTCTECKKGFFKKGDFTRHMRIHTGEKPYVCVDCQKRFTLKGNLDQHRLVIHSRDRPYKCTECEKSFCRQSHLIKHRRLHTMKFLNIMQ